MARRRVGGGRLRVDAARAVTKLREFQLWDPALWALEVARAAIALGASALHAEGDADDVWVRWGGEPIADADLLTLFDELVSPVTDAERRPLRLLAAGVNSALGAATSFVDVWSFREGRAAHRVRYTPDVLVVDDETSGVATGLRKLRVEKTTPPRGSIPKGATVHVRRSPSLGVLGRFLAGTEPREIAALRRACEDASLPVRVGGATLGGGRSSFDLLRVRLGSGLDGFIALTERVAPSDDSACALLDVGELGVHLASYPLDLGLGPARSSLPVRVWIDAAAMPTNASRSDVRRDEPPVSEAIEAARARFPDLVAAMVRRLSGEGDATGDAAERKQRERVHAATMRLIASFASGPLWHVGVRALDGHAIAPLLAVPLVRDALGRPRSLSSLALLASGDDQAALVHRGDEPVDSRLEPWLGDVLWIPPGDASRVLLAGAEPPDVRIHIKKAKHSLKAREAFRKRPQRPLAVGEDPRLVLAVALDRVFDVADPWAARIAAAGELRGELALLVPDPEHRHGGRIELFHEGRVVCVEPLALGPPFVAALEASHLRPSLDYREMERAEPLDATMLAVRAAAIRAAEAVARWLLGVEPAAYDRRRGLSRAAPNEEIRIAAAGIARHGLSEQLALLAEIGVEAAGVPPVGVEDEAEPRPKLKTRKGQKAARAAVVASESPLLDAAVWPMADGSWASVRGLDRGGPAGTPIGVVAPAKLRRGLPARPIVVAGERDTTTLRRVLRRSVALLSYDMAATEPYDAFRAARDVLPDRGAVLAVDEGRRRGVIVWGGRTESLEVRHANRILAVRPRPGVLGPCAIVVDDDDLVPMPGWQEIAGGETKLAALAPALVEWEHRMLDAVARAALGETTDAELLLHPFAELRPLNEALRRILLTARARLRPDLRWPSPKVREQLDDIPLVPVAMRGLVTLRVLRTEPGDALAYLPAEAIQPGDEVESGTWWIVCSAQEAVDIGRVVGREIPSALPRLEKVRVDSARRAAIRRHSSKPRLPLETTGMVGGVFVRRESKVRISGDGVTDGLVAIPSRPMDSAAVSIRFDGREVVELRLPELPGVVAAFEVERSLLDDALADLTADGRRRVERRVLDATALVLEDVGRREPVALLEDSAVTPVFGTFVRGQRPLALATFAGLASFRSIQGPRVSVKAALRGGAVQISKPAGEWLAPLESERPTELDEPIVAVASDGETWLLGQLTGARLADRTDAVAELRAVRRLARGLATRPTLPYSSDAMTVDVAELTKGSADLARVVGIGEVEITEPGQGRAWLYADRVLRHEMPLADALPGLAIRAALESAAVSVGKPSVVRQREIERALELVAQRALVAVCLRGGRVNHTEGLRTAARSVWSRGEPALRAALDDFALFPLTSGSWMSPRQARAEVASRGELRFTTDAQSRTLLDDPSIPVVRFDLALDPEIVTRERDALDLWNVTEELRTLEIARRNRQRPAVEHLLLTNAAAHGALVRVPLDGDGTTAPRGVVAPLLPEAASHRGIRVHRAMVPFGDVADFCEWPTAASVDDGRLTPNPRWEAIEDDARLGALRDLIRAASEHGIAHRFVAPESTVSLPVDAAFSREAVPDRAVVFRGVLWIDATLETAGRLTVISAGGTAYRAVAVKVGDERRPLPLRGALLVHCERDPNAAEPALASIARRAYSRLVMSALASEALGADATMAHVVTALDTAVLAAKDVRGKDDPLECTRPRLTLARVAAFLKGNARALVHAPNEEPWEGAKGELTIVEDGSKVASALIEALGRRVDRVAEIRARERAQRDAPVVVTPLGVAPGAQASTVSGTNARADVVGASGAASASPASRVKKSKVAEDPERDLLAALARRIALMSLTPDRIEVVRGHRKSKVVLVVDRPDVRVELGLDSPLGARLLAARARRADDAVADALDLLAAHIAGEIDQLYETVTPEHQLRAVTRLLEATR